MSGLKILAVVLIVGGILGLVYGGFTYTKETHSAKLGLYAVMILTLLGCAWALSDIRRSGGVPARRPEKESCGVRARRGCSATGLAQYSTRTR